MNAPAWSKCLPWITKFSEKAQNVTQRRQSGNRVIAMMAQGLLWRYNGDNSDRLMHAFDWPKEAQGRQKHRFKWKTLFTISILQPQWYVCLLSTSFEQHVSNQPLFWTCSKLYGNHGIHGHVWTYPVPLLNDQGNHLASLERPPMATWPVLWLHMVPDPFPISP